MKCYTNTYNVYFTVWLESLGLNLSDVNDLSSVAAEDKIILPVYEPGNLIHGLECTTKLRLADHKNPILLCCFQSIEAIQKIDKYSVLKTSGSNFIRLPVKKNDFILFLEKTGQMSFEKLMAFKSFYYKEQLFQTIRSLKHGGKYDFLSTSSGPLRAACIMAQSDITASFLLKTKLAKFKENFADIKEVTDGLSMVEKTSKLSEKENDYFKWVVEFYQLISTIATTEYTLDNESLNSLIKTIDRLNIIHFRLESI